MAEANQQVTPSESLSGESAGAIAHLKQALADGKHWYLALLEAIGLWADAEEVRHLRTYRYLIDGEAFDWLLLAERLCDEVTGLLPEAEKDALLLYGKPPLTLSEGEVKELVGAKKYRQYLNYFYGVTVEGVLLLAVQDDIEKERRVSGIRSRPETTEEVYPRVYEATRAELLKSFRRDKGYSHPKSMTLTEMNEFTYWLFKYRLKQSEKARIASDTRKALDYLQHLGSRKGILWTMASEKAAD